MRIFPFGISALALWLTEPLSFVARGASTPAVMRDCEPTERVLAYVQRRFPQMPLPIEVAVPGRSRRAPAGLRAHACALPLSMKAFVRAESGVFVPRPELCFVQAARSLPFPELVKAGNALCGAYRVAPECSHRLVQREPVTSPEKIARFIAQYPGLTGAKNARIALQGLTGSAASPPEAYLATVLGLPYRLGGFGLEGLVLNRRIDLSRKASSIVGCSTLVPDVFFPDAGVVVEYDSNSEHLDAPQVTRDSLKRLAYEADGYHVFTVTARQLGDAKKLRSVAERVAHCAGRRVRPQGKLFPQKHAALLRAGWSLEGFIDPLWLRR